MSDYNSQLPVRTENAGDVAVKIVDATITSRQLAINVDGSINTVTNLSATDFDIRDLSHTQDSIKIGDGTDFLSVNADGSINSVVTATDLDIRNLVFATDKVDASGSTVELGATTLSALESITVQNGAGASAVNIQDGGNSITVDGSVTVSATDLDIRNLVFATDKVDVSNSTVELGATTLSALESITIQNGAGVSAVNIQDGGNSITVDATNLDIRDLVAATDSVSAHLKDSAGVAFSNTNALPVVYGVHASRVADYNTAAAVAGGASSTHTYTSTGNFYLNQVEASASGKLKIEVQVNSVTKLVLFNSAANPNLQIKLSEPILATSGQTVTVIRTNKENQSQDVYSTVVGYLG